MSSTAALMRAIFSLWLILVGVAFGSGGGDASPVAGVLARSAGRVAASSAGGWSSGDAASSIAAYSWQKHNRSLLRPARWPQAGKASGGRLLSMSEKL